MKNILIITSLFFVFVAQSQQEGNDVWYTVQKDSVKRYVHFSSEGFYGSTIFNNEMMQKFYRGGFIDKEMKDKALEKTRGVNYLGGEFKTQITYSDISYKLFKGFGYYAGLSYHNQASLRFSRDLYRLAFYGNKTALGETLRLGGSSGAMFDYNRFSFGLNKDNKIKIGLSFNFYNHSIQSEILRGDLTADSSGTKLNADGLLGYILYSDGAVGAGLDFEYTHKINKSDSTARINLGIRNLGWVTRKEAYAVTAAGSYEYKGVEVGNLSSIGDSITTQTQRINDSLDVQSGTVSVSKMLPFELYFYQVPSYKKRLEVLYGLKYRSYGNSKTFIYAGGNFHFKQRYNISTYLSYGGYTNLQWGMNFQAHLKRNNIGISTGNILGFLSKESMGKSLGISFTHILN